MADGDDQIPGAEINLELVLAALRRDYKELPARIRTLQHSFRCECENVTLRVNYPAFRDGDCTVADLVELLTFYLAQFSLPRSEIDAVDAQYGIVSPQEFRLRTNRLQQKAIRLFKRAQKATNRNGEAGELLLYLLTEWILEAPQLIAKMSLKTNKDMPVHGADGVHVRFSRETGQLQFYWGESKIYADVGQGINAAINSIADSLSDEKLSYELELVGRHITLTGLNEDAKNTIIKYLDPFEEESNQRTNVTTCLIGFDFDAYTKLKRLKPRELSKVFEEEVVNKITELSPTVSDALRQAGLDHHMMEIFFFPLPSVVAFRDLFQDKIGWHREATPTGPEVRRRDRTRTRAEAQE